MSSEQTCVHCNNTNGEHKPDCMFYTPKGRWDDLSTEQQSLHLERHSRQRMLADRRGLGDEVCEGTVFTAYTRYKVKLDQDNLALIERYDDVVEDVTGQGSLEYRLENEVDASDIAFGRRLDPYVFFSFDEEYDGNLARVLAKRIVLDFLEEAKAYYKDK